MRWVGPAAAGALMLAGAALVGRQGCLEAKAALAGVLIGQALERTLADGRPRAPWSWADFRTIALLEVPRLGIRDPVLSGATGSTLAFGIGHVDGTALPGAAGNVVLAGHRDRQLAFLRRLRPGDRIDLRTAGGARSYRVRTLRVVGEGHTRVTDPDAGDRLILITCYPLEGVLPSPWRAVVICDPAPGASPAG